MTDDPCDDCSHWAGILTRSNGEVVRDTKGLVTIVARDPVNSRKGGT